MNELKKKIIMNFLARVAEWSKAVSYTEKIGLYMHTGIINASIKQGNIKTAERQVRDLKKYISSFSNKIIIF